MVGATVEGGVPHHPKSGSLLHNAASCRVESLEARNTTRMSNWSWRDNGGARSCGALFIAFAHASAADPSLSHDAPRQKQKGSCVISSLPREANQNQPLVRCSYRVNALCLPGLSMAHKLNLKRSSPSYLMTEDQTINRSTLHINQHQQVKKETYY